MKTEKHNIFAGISFSIAGFSLFAMGDAVYKVLTPSYSIWLILFFTSISILLMASLFSPWLGGFKKTFQSRHLKLHALRALLVFAQIAAFLYGLRTLSLADSYALAFASPFMAALLAIPVLHEKATMRLWLSILLGFAGVLIILRPGLIPVSPAALMILLSAFLFALANILTRFIGGEEETLLSWTLFPQMALLIGAGFLSLPDFTLPSPFHMSLILFIAATVMAGSILMAHAFIRAPAAIVAPFHYIQILWGIGLGYMLFGDLPDLWTLFGAAIIITSGIWIVRHSKGAKAVISETPPAPAPAQDAP